MQVNNELIMHAAIIPMNARVGRMQATLMVEMTSGEICDVFNYYTDEISFSADEFIGYTFREAVNLFHKRDIEYLRS